MKEALEALLEISLAEVVGNTVPPDREAEILDRVRALRARQRATRWTWLVAALILAAFGLHVLLHRGAGLTAEETARLDRWHALVSRSDRDLPLDDPRLPRYIGEQIEARFELLDHLDRYPHAFGYTREQLTDRLRGNLAVDVRRRLLGILTRDPTGASDSILGAALDGDPATFDGELLVALCERGVPGARALAERKIESPPPIAHDLALAAAWFALRGDDRGRQLLGRALASGRLIGSQPIAFFAAALALEHIGDERAWQRLYDVTREVIESELASGRVTTARQLALILEWFDAARGREEPPPLAHLDYRLTRYWREHGDRLPDAESIRALLERLGR